MVRMMTECGRTAIFKAHHGLGTCYRCAFFSMKAECPGKCVEPENGYWRETLRSRLSRWWASFSARFVLDPHPELHEDHASTRNSSPPCASCGCADGDSCEACARERAARLGGSPISRKAQEAAAFLPENIDENARERLR